MSKTTSTITIALKKDITRNISMFGVIGNDKVTLNSKTPRVTIKRTDLLPMYEKSVARFSKYLGIVDTTEEDLASKEVEDEVVDSNKQEEIGTTLSNDVETDKDDDSDDVDKIDLDNGSDESSEEKSKDEGSDTDSDKDSNDGTSEKGSEIQSSENSMLSEEEIADRNQAIQDLVNANDKSALVEKCTIAEVATDGTKWDLASRLV